MEITLILLEKAFLALFFAVAAAIAISKLCGKQLNLPPSPTPIPIFGNWLQLGDNINHRVLARLAKKHGEIFLLRMGIRNLVVISSPLLAKEVLHTQGVEFGSHARNVVFDIFTGKGQDLIFTVYGDHWRKMRRIATVPFFTSKAVLEHRCVWEDEAARLVDGLKATPSTATEGVNLRMRIQLLMHNNVYIMMFGRMFESVDDPLFLKLHDLNMKRAVLAQSLGYNYGDFIPLLRPFVRGYLKICEEASRKRLELFDFFIQERKKLASRLEKVGIDHILEAEENGVINKDNVLYLIENMNIAGIDTIARAIEWGIADITNHPQVLNKLRLELDTVLGRGVQITEPDVQRLPYLNAVIKEILRLRMVAPLLLPHMNINQAKLGRFDIPAERRIFVNAWWLANNPSHWKAPEEFRPERFLEEEANVEITGNDFRYIPFGVGRRSCPGIVLAMPIFSLTLGRLVQNFEFSLPKGQSKIDTAERSGQFSLHMLNPFTVVLKPR